MLQKWTDYLLLTDCPENLDILLASAMLGLLVVPVGYILWPLVLRQKFPEYGGLIALINISSWIGAITATAMAKKFSHLIVRPGQAALAIWSISGMILLLLIVVDSFVALCLAVIVIGTVKLGKALVYGKYLHNSPTQDRGVLVAVDQTAFWGLATLGTFCLGALVDIIGLNATIVVNSICMLICVVGLTYRGYLLKIKAI